jgi:vacuolar iron transporter family protein
MERRSLHVEPRGATDTARHYIRDVVYGANDGIITTFAVVSGVAGGGLSTLAILVIGAANLAADGMSMGAGNLLAIRADERAREAADLPELEAFPWKHGLATTIAFVTAGVIPLLPFVIPAVESRTFLSTVLTFGALFTLGALRAFITIVLLGSLVAVAACIHGVARPVDPATGQRAHRCHREIPREHPVAASRVTVSRVEAGLQTGRQMSCLATARCCRYEA